MKLGFIRTVVFNLIFVAFAGTAFAGAKLPNLGIIKFKGTVEMFDISDLKGTPVESPNVSKVESYFSLSDNKFIIKFNPLQMSMAGGGKDAKMIQKTDFVYDGKVLKEFRYKTQNSDGRIENNNMLITRPFEVSTIYQLEDFYLGKLLFADYITFFRGDKNISVLDAIMGNIKFPIIEKRQQADTLSLTATTETDKIEAVVSLRYGNPVPVRFSASGYAVGSGEKRSDIIFDYSKDTLKVEGLGIYAPASFQRVLLVYPENKGFKIVVKVDSLEFLKDVSLDSLVPNFPSH